MSEPPPNAQPRTTFFGALLCRVIVPLWVLAGAAFKLYERNPGNLPSVIRDASKTFGLENLDTLLRVLIGCEFFAVAVMLLLPRFARAMAIFMLSCFCLILIGEMIKGATSCGCFGSLPVKPWQMLVIDGSLLLLTIAFPYSGRTPANARGALIASAALAAISMAVAIGVPNPPSVQQDIVSNGSPVVPPATQSTPTTQIAQGRTPEQPVGPTPDGPPAPPSTQDQGPQPGPPAPPAPPSSDPTINPSPRALPSSWYTQEMDKWIDKPWRELEIFQLMPRWPRDMDTGKRYIILYSRTCEHCQQMLDEDLITPLDGLITLVQVPASRTLMTDPAGWAMPAHVETVLKAELLDLPLGPNWIITTPLVIAVKDGKVTCATEGEDHKKCLGLE